MGIIATLTPGTFGTKPILRVNITAEDIAATGRIELKTFIPKCNGLKKVHFEKLADPHVEDVTENADFLWNTLMPLRSPCPLWSGMM